MLKRIQQFKLQLLLKILSELQMAPQQLPVSDSEGVMFLFAAKKCFFGTVKRFACFLTIYVHAPLQIAIQLICLFLVMVNIIICVSGRKKIRRDIKLFRGTELINCKLGERDTLQN